MTVLETPGVIPARHIDMPLPYDRMGPKAREFYEELVRKHLEDGRWDMAYDLSQAHGYQQGTLDAVKILIQSFIESNKPLKALKLLELESEGSIPKMAPTARDLGNLIRTVEMRHIS